MTKNNLNEEKTSNESFFKRLEKGGLNYINHQKTFLLISAIVPAFILTAQVISFIFQLILEIYAPPTPIQVRPNAPLLDKLLPMILLIIVGGFAFLNYVFLRRWKKIVEEYKAQQLKDRNIKKFDEEMENFKNRISLTDIFYRIINNLNTIKYTFFILNIFYGFYILWYYLIYFIGLPGQRPFLLEFIIILTMGSQFILNTYILYEWYHLLKWNIKLRELKKYEKRIYFELFTP